MILRCESRRKTEEECKSNSKRGLKKQYLLAEFCFPARENEISKRGLKLVLKWIIQRQYKRPSCRKWRQLRNQRNQAENGKYQNGKCLILCLGYN